jgi:hypothetical protein
MQSGGEGAVHALACGSLHYAERVRLPLRLCWLLR